MCFDDKSCTFPNLYSVFWQVLLKLTRFRFAVTLCRTVLSAQSSVFAGEFCLGAQVCTKTLNHSHLQKNTARILQRNICYGSCALSKICPRRTIEKRTIMTAMPGQDYLFRQLFDSRSYTYTYLLADTSSRAAVLIDPVIDLVDRDVRIVGDLGLDLVYAINTHVHADHITGTGEIKKRIPTCRSVISEPKAKADVHITHGNQIEFGKFKLECRSTPGHTDGCMTYVFHEKSMAFTGDALLIRGCGRTDFQQGDPGTLFEAVHGQIFSLPESFLLYPAHDYTGQTVTTVGEEKKLNPRLTKTKDEFIKIMNELGLPYPKQIDKALPANMVCGV